MDKVQGGKKKKREGRENGKMERRKKKGSGKGKRKRGSR